MLVQIKTKEGNDIKVIISDSKDIALLEELIYKLDIKDNYDSNIPYNKYYPFNIKEPYNPKIYEVTCSIK